MSAGRFELTRYAASYGGGTQIHPIRVQEETLALSITPAGGDAVTNDAPAGATTSPISAVVSRGKRAGGLRPRLVSIKFTGTPPDGYSANQVIRLPWLTPFPVNFAKSNVGVYLSAPIIVVGLTSEEAK